MKELSDKERIEKLTKALREVREQLYDWATESMAGGWSTHQVEAQQNLAGQLGLTIYIYGNKK